ncbi:hypothetical protein E5672_01225 [Alteromonas portus]|uniref:DUF3575 domain-containing protein n=1 Tax=Alteromonas portus TaxID=2565549 RepID=A0A4U0ZIW1_9ALTE|nr:hypothetical protein [Alteromonas portus]TKB04743.1 hypothetical protein E5672_01225 [Alteromonas portus]
MNVVTGTLIAFTLAASLTALPVCAGINDSNNSPIQFKSKKIARWQLNSMYRVQSTTETYLYDNSYTYPAGSQGMFSASRRFDTRIPQKVYATYKTNNTAFQHYAEWLYLPHDIGTFTRLGWLLGKNEGLNMAVEIEHRQVGEEENMAFSLGVNYLF